MGQQKLISIIVPVYNEGANIPRLVYALAEATKDLPYKFELVLVNDGSRDDSALVLTELTDRYKNLHALHLARNFGKEIALTAGLHHAQGDAAIMMDADLQHPPKYIPDFVAKWEQGAEVVIGVRTEDGKESLIKRLGAKVFYAIMNRIAHVRIVPHATDFRLIDRSVIGAYNQFTERNRIVRGLIDWLGFERDYVHFKADKRTHGEATYSTGKLIKLAMDSFVSMSFAPLKFSGVLGGVIIALSLPLGLFMLADKYLLGNMFDFSGPAALGTLILFLVGVTLVNLGFISLYIANIHDEVTNRPLYVVRSKSIAERSTAVLAQANVPSTTEASFQHGRATDSPDKPELQPKLPSTHSFAEAEA